jgi:transcriptional regulator with GAF, ATPase, and Fis domain
VQLAGMRRLLDFSRMMAEPADLQPLLEELVDQVVALTKASKGFLVLAEADGTYSVRVARNLERAAISDPAELLSDDIVREVMQSRRAQIISDALSDRRFQNSLSVMNLRLSSVMCAPLQVRGDFLGLIYVGNDAVVDLFRPEQLEALEVFASQAALFIRAARAMNELRSAKQGLEGRLEAFRFGSIIGACPAMLEVYRKVEKVAGLDVTVLVTGETGTGKELIAHEIHARSPRARGPFVTVNCGAIPENLIESELFGHVKGAFTGAIANQMGKFQAADGGTIFLDEIGELPLPMQVKLLRVLQERAFQRVGDTKATTIDIRVVAATNRDLRKEVAEQRFREDLFFRLDVVGIELPPLRERGDDVLVIARYLVARFAREYGRAIDAEQPFTDPAVHALLKFSWPGNIRQLENHIKKALVLSDGPRITPVDLGLDLELGRGEEDSPSSPEDVLPLADARERWQRTYINRILALNGGNRTKTARDLGVDPRTIFRHLEKEAERGREDEDVG